MYRDTESGGCGSLDISVGIGETASQRSTLNWRRLINMRDMEEDRTTKAEEQVKSDHLLNLHLHAGRCDQGKIIGSMAGLKAMLTEAGLR